MNPGNWPTTQQAESWEIKQTLYFLSRFAEFGEMRIKKKREKPDYEVEKIAANTFIGIELTSVYISDRSVVDRHKKEGIQQIDPNDGIRMLYFNRVLKAINKKVKLARSGYDIYPIMILSLYINEYEDIYNSKKDWEEWAKRNNHILDNIDPFTHLILWPLMNEPDDPFDQVVVADSAMLITPSSGQ